MEIVRGLLGDELHNQIVALIGGAGKAVQKMRKGMATSTSSAEYVDAGLSQTQAVQ